MSTNFDDKVRKAGNAYRPEPKLLWSDIEPNLKDRRPKRRFSMSSLLAVAATIVILVLAFTIFAPQGLQDYDNSLFAESSNVHDLKLPDSDEKSQSQYSIKDVYLAYHSAGLLQKRH